MRNRLFIVFSVLIVIIVGLGLFIWTNYYSTVADVREMFINVDRTNPYEYGETLFETRGCVFCHTLSDASSSATIGPILDGIGGRADADHIRESIINPDSVIAADCGGQACEAGVMPQFGGVLDETQIEALVAYLLAQP